MRRLNELTINRGTYLFIIYLPERIKMIMEKGSEGFHEITVTIISMIIESNVQRKFLYF